MNTSKKSLALFLIIIIYFNGTTFAQELKKVIRVGDRINIVGILTSFSWIDSEKYITEDGQRKRLIYLINFDRNALQLIGIDNINKLSELIGQKVALQAVVRNVGNMTQTQDVYQTKAIGPCAQCYVDFISWDKKFEQMMIAQKKKQDKEISDTKQRQIDEQLRAQEVQLRAKAEAEFQAAQEKMRIEDEKEKLREQRIADLKSGKMKITNIEDAKLAFNPSDDNKYTIGLPIDGLTNTGDYYIWSGTLSWKSGNIYFCLDSGGQTKCFGFTDIIVRFNEMRENSPVTVVGKLTGTSEVTLVNKFSGVKENKTVAVLTDCYVF